MPDKMISELTTASSSIGGYIPIVIGSTTPTTYKVLAETIVSDIIDYGVATIDADYEVADGVVTVFVDTASALTITIPEGYNVGHSIVVSRISTSASAITLAGSGSETIEGAATFVTHGTTVSAVLNLSEVVLKKVSSTVWRFVRGAVSGSNSNGSYVKFSDGTMQCWGTWSVSGGSVASFTFTVTYPVSFISVSYNNAIRHTGGYPYWTLIAQTLGVSSTSVTFNQINNNASDIDSDGSWFAIGRWRA